jgi:hypothetical protein
VEKAVALIAADDKMNVGDNYYVTREVKVVDRAKEWRV